MKRLICVFLSVIFLSGCTASALNSAGDNESDEDRLFCVSRITNSKGTSVVLNDDLKGMWVSQFDMHPIYRDGGMQRAQDDYEAKVGAMMQNLARDGFNTVFLQVRPNGDSMYESEIYPTSKYVAGVYGGSIEYDAVAIFLEIAKASGISVHAWINPFRLCKEDELLRFGKGTLFEWASEGFGKRIERGADGILYLDPYYEEATEMIVAGVEEILQKYSFDGIHLDDYFYPTEFEFEDDAEFKASGFANKGDFRRSNINRTVKAIYEAVHRFDSKVFGISPAGNIYSLENGWYADIYRWCSEDGFIDYIMPQLYFGFKNATCPFEEVFDDWCNAVTNESTRLYIGLSAAKCALGSEGQADTYAGEGGKYEWRDSKDILARSVTVINNSERASGFCIFAYSSFYNPLTGEENPLTSMEKAAFCEAVS